MTQTARLRNVPNQPKRRSPRNVRVPDELWEAALTAVRRLTPKLYLSDIIRWALEDFLKDPAGWVARHRRPAQPTEGENHE